MGIPKESETVFIQTFSGTDPDISILLAPVDHVLCRLAAAYADIAQVLLSKGDTP